MNTRLMWRFLASTLIMLTLAASSLTAEEPIYSEYPYCCQGNRYNSRRGQNYRRYDSKTIETLDGKVIRLDSNQSRIGTFQGTHLMMKTAQETIEVHVAPSWFLAEQDFDLAPKEKIVVIGSRINVDGKPAMVAREIKKGDRTLVLRDENGIPMWSGGQQ